MSNPFNFHIVLARLRAVKSELPTLLANQAENFWVDNFKREQWDGKSWRTPKRRIPGTPAYRWPKSKGLTRRTKRTLIGSSRLRTAVSNSARYKSFERITFIVDLPYARIHNEGGRITKASRTASMNFRVNKVTGETRFATKKKANFQQDVTISGHDINIPKRQYMGDHKDLRRKQIALLKKEVSKAWR